MNTKKDAEWCLPALASQLFWFHSVGNHGFMRGGLFCDLGIIFFVRARDGCRSGADHCFSVYGWTSMPKKNSRQEESEDGDYGRNCY
jgi:hypothetical protein